MLNWIRNLDIRGVAFALGVVAAVAHGVVSGQVPLDHLFPDAWHPYIIAWLGVYLYVFPLIVGAHSYTAASWTDPAEAQAKQGGPTIRTAAVIAAFLIGSLALLGPIEPLRAADLPSKAPKFVSPFVPNSAGGSYVGLGTSAGVANGSTSGSNLLAPNLIGGNLVADGASIDVVGGYIRNGGPLNTWWRIQVGASYQDIAGGTASGSINSRWRLDQEADVGADIVQSIFSAIGNVGNLSSTFSALGNFAPSLPANVKTVGTPRQYVGVVLEESLLGGSAFGSSGQSWIVAPGVKTGWIWELPDASGKPNGNALEVNAQVTWPTQGVSFNNVLAANGSPVVIGPAIKEGANYRAGIVYHFGL